MKKTEFRKLIREEVRKVIKEANVTMSGDYNDSDFDGPAKKAQETDWSELDWDFSDSDSVNFGDFEVDIDQFKKGIKNGYVIDDNGDKRSINKSIIKDILQSYKENY